MEKSPSGYRSTARFVCDACACTRNFPFSTVTAKPSSTGGIIIRKNNIDEEKEMKRTQNMISLFLIFMKIGLFTFGGGYAMIPLIQRETVDNKKWISDKDILDIVAIAESTPGPIAINAATFIGYRVGGFLGAMAATVGVVLPSFTIIAAISYVLAAFQNVVWIQYAFNGIRAGVLALIVKALWSMYKQSPKGVFSYLIMFGAFAVTAFLPVNVVFVILFCAAVGILQTLITGRWGK